MSNLTNNTASLQAILNTINELPEAGQGGTNTSDATVTANDLAEGVISYGKDGKVTGTVKTIKDSEGYVLNDATVASDGDELSLVSYFPKDVLHRENSYAMTRTPLSKFGDATATDVLEGRTFTSADGLKVVGTGTLKMFTWEKYSTTNGTTSEAYSQQEVANKSAIRTGTNMYSLFSDMTFNADTGVYTLSGGVYESWGNVYNNKTYETHPYYYVNDEQTKIAKITSMSSKGGVVATYNVVYTEYYSLANEQGVVKGSYIEDVTSTYSHEYPADGYQDGYWYVLKSEGGSGGSIEGLENGYNVMFYDENNDGLAFYSIKQGHSINPPVYDCKTWQTDAGANVEFPYTPTEDVILYANNDTFASEIYKFYGIDSAVYPYITIFAKDGWGVQLNFSQVECTMTDTNLFAQANSDKPRKYASSNGFFGTDGDVGLFVQWLMENCVMKGEATSSSGQNVSTFYIYTNYDTSAITSALGKYRLDV